MVHLDVWVIYVGVQLEIIHTHRVTSSINFNCFKNFWKNNNNETKHNMVQLLSERLEQKPMNKFTIFSLVVVFGFFSFSPHQLLTDSVFLLINYANSC